MGRLGNRPSWTDLYEISAAQDGHFTSAQASAAGYSPQLLAKYLQRGKIRRVRRGIYRIVHFPAGEHEDLVVLWLWSRRAGVFSHETALALHELSDVLPSKVFMTLPTSWRQRRLRVPLRLFLHFGDVGENERTWVGAVPVISVPRTLIDCARTGVAPEVLRDAFEDAADRGLVVRNSVPEVIAYLDQFYSVSRGRSGPRFRSSTATTSRHP